MNPAGKLWRGSSAGQFQPWRRLAPCSADSFSLMNAVIPVTQTGRQQITH